jgi:ferric-dicitrate binding protein FerR (iron transport regulator)
MKPRKQPAEMAALVSAMCGEYITETQLDRLNLLLVTDCTARTEYLRYMSAEASYERLLGGPAVSVAPEEFTRAERRNGEEPALPEIPEPVAEKSLDDAWVLPAIPRSEDPAEAVEIDASRFASPRRMPSPVSRRRSTLVRWSAAAAVLLATGVALWFGMQRLDSPPIAMVVKSAASKWDGGKTLRDGEGLSAGQHDLESGVAQLSLPGGVSVIVEGPAKFKVDSATGVSLLAGKLVATVPHEVSGFTVFTPDGNIVDLGTQFGVDVRAGTPTHTEVFQGQIHVLPRSAGDGGTTLAEGQALDLSATGTTMDPSGSMAQHFVSDLGGGAISLDVADLIAGGDGTTHRRGGMIDPQTGAIGRVPLTGLISSDSIYHHATSLPVIDGCFIPNGAKGPVQVDSAGHTFALPATDGKTYDRIFSGNQIPRPGTGRVPLRTMLGNVDYSRPDRWFLYLHANVGLTFDLAALRRLHPGSALQRFHAVVGNIRPGTLENPLPVELFVLADGELRFHRRFEGRDIFTVDLPLNDSDRALSLIITDGGAGNAGDDIMFGDPVFDMRAGQ